MCRWQRPGCSRIAVATHPAETAPAGMVRIPGGAFTYRSTRSFLSPNEVIPYPGSAEPRTYPIPPFYMDIYPVTNAQFKEFMIGDTVRTGRSDELPEALGRWRTGAGHRAAPGGLYRQERCRGLCPVGRKAAADRSGMAVCRAGDRRTEVSVGTGVRFHAVQLAERRRRRRSMHSREVRVRSG